MKSLLLERNAAQMKKKQNALRDEARSRASKVAHARGRAIRWTLDQLKRATGPMVYIWWGHSENPLYIGMSRIGLNRAVSESHNNCDVLKTAISIEFICCISTEEASELERELIRIMRPQHNRIRY